LTGTLPNSYWMKTENWSLCFITKWTRWAKKLRSIWI